MLVNAASAGKAFNERRRKPLTSADVRFTTKGPHTLYAFVMGWPQGEVMIQALGTASPQAPGKVQQLELLGYGGKLQFQQEAAGLRVQLPAAPPVDYGIALKITL